MLNGTNDWTAVKTTRRSNNNINIIRLILLLHAEYNIAPNRI